MESTCVNLRKTWNLLKYCLTVHFDLIQSGWSNPMSNTSFKIMLPIFLSCFNVWQPLKSDIYWQVITKIMFYYYLYNKEHYKLFNHFISRFNNTNRSIFIIFLIKSLIHHVKIYYFIVIYYYILLYSYILVQKIRM